MKKFAAAVCAATLAVSAYAGLSVDTSITSDSDFNAMGVNELWVAEGRTGNNGPSGDWEVGIGEPDTNPPDSQTNYVWGNPSTVDFSIQTVGGNLVFTLDSATVQIATPADLGDTLFVRARALGKNGGTADLSLTDLVINGMALTETLNGDDNANYLKVSGLGGGSLDITGKASVAWSGAFPNGSRIGFTFKAANTVIPEPAAVMLGLIGVRGVLAARRRA